MQIGGRSIDGKEIEMIYTIELEKCSIRFAMELDASSEADAQRKLDEAMLLYDQTPTTILAIHAKDPLHDSPDAG